MSERGAEIDFVIERDGNPISIEVKSAENTKECITDTKKCQKKSTYCVKILYYFDILKSR